MTETVYLPHPRVLDLLRPLQRKQQATCNPRSDSDGREAPSPEQIPTGVGLISKLPSASTCHPGPPLTPDRPITFSIHTNTIHHPSSHPKRKKKGAHNLSLCPSACLFLFTHHALHRVLGLRS